MELFKNTALDLFTPYAGYGTGSLKKDNMIKSLGLSIIALAFSSFVLGVNIGKDLEHKRIQSLYCSGELCTQIIP